MHSYRQMPAKDFSFFVKSVTFSVSHDTRGRGDVGAKRMHDEASRRVLLGCKVGLNYPRFERGRMADLISFLKRLMKSSAH
jgi:hypothetical protein